MELHVEITSKNQKRGVYLLPVNSLDSIWTWTCMVCPYRCQDVSKSACQKLANAHDCPYGWCTVPMTPERAKLLGRPHIPEPTKEDRRRWSHAR